MLHRHQRLVHNALGLLLKPLFISTSRNMPTNLNKGLHHCNTNNQFREGTLVDNNLMDNGEDTNELLNEHVLHLYRTPLTFFVQLNTTACYFSVVFRGNPA